MNRRVRPRFALLATLLALAIGWSQAPALLTGADAAAPLVLRASIQSPKPARLSMAYDWLLDEIEKRTGGRVKFERYYGGALADAKGQLDAVSDQVAHIALFVPGYVPAKVPLATVGTVPALWSDAYVGSKAFHELFKQSPELQKELEAKKAKFIGGLATPSYHLVSAKKLGGLGDLKGMRIMTSGQIAVLLKRMGAQPVSIPTPEGYEALQRGTVDGGVYGVTAAATYNIEKVTKTFWLLPFGGLPMIVAMNLDAWKALPADIQKIIQEVAEEHPKRFHEIYQIEGDGASLKKFLDAGVEVRQPTAQESAAVRAAAREIWDQWVSEQEQAGRPGRQLLNKFVQLVERYTAENPYARK